MNECPLPTAQQTVHVPAKFAEETEATKGDAFKMWIFRSKGRGLVSERREERKESEGRTRAAEKLRGKERGGGPRIGDELGQDKKRSGNKAGICPHPAGAGRTRAPRSPGPTASSASPAQMAVKMGSWQRGARRPYPWHFSGVLTEKSQEGLENLF